MFGKNETDRFCVILLTKTVTVSEEKKKHKIKLYCLENK